MGGAGPCVDLSRNLVCGGVRDVGSRLLLPETDAPRGIKYKTLRLEFSKAPPWLLRVPSTPAASGVALEFSPCVRTAALVHKIRHRIILDRFIRRCKVSKKVFKIYFILVR